MAKLETTEYFCDNCDKKLRTHSNSLAIVTSKIESLCWRRLKVEIKLRHGVNNNVTEDNADLCQACAVALLKDAMERVIAGERTTAGTGSSEQEGWLV